MSAEASTVLAPPASVAAARAPGRAQGRPVAAALVLIALGLWRASQAVGWRQAALFLVGVGAGIVLYHAAFGFTSAWRVFIADRRSRPLGAQMLMLALAAVVFIPALAAGELLGQPVRGAIAPLGCSLLVGAFLFGVGMQLGGG